MITRLLLKAWQRAFLFALTLLFLWRCNEQNNTPEKTIGFSLELNTEQIFSVSETNFTINDEANQSSYLIRELVVDIQQLEFETIYTIEQYHRKTENERWRIERVYQLKQTPAELIEIGELPVVRLTFPVIDNSSFDVNKYNNVGRLNATYKNVNEAFESNTDTFSVFQANDSTLINLNRIVDIYSASDGLIYKEDTDVSYCQSSPECIGTGEISFGKSVIWRRVK